MYSISAHLYLQTLELAERWQAFQRFKSVTLQEEGFETSVRFQMRNALKALEMQVQFVIQRRRFVELRLLAYVPQSARGHLHRDWLTRHKLAVGISNTRTEPGIQSRQLMNGRQQACADRNKLPR